MAHMEPQYNVDYPHRFECRECGADALLPTDAEPEHCPECWSEDITFFGLSDEDWAQEFPGEEPRPLVWTRLSAPGYLDCTEWSGPFPNVFRAARWLAEFYQIHPRTGEELEVL